MATVEKTGLMTHIDASGNKTVLYPVTIPSAVDGLEELLAKASPHNLLDNSDFRNPVNQRVLASYTGPGYAIDRWYAETSAVTVEVNDGYITINKGTGYGGIYQNLEQHDRLKGKMCTLAINIDGVVYTQAFALGQYGGGVRLGNTAVMLYSIDGMSVLLRHDDNKSSNVYWAALYEGEYTAETIPEYRPKGYGVELLECLRYYQYVEILAGPGAATSQRQFFTLPIPMRVTPTCEYFHAGDTPNEVTVRNNRLIDVIGASTYSHVFLHLSADL